MQHISTKGNFMIMKWNSTKKGFIILFDTVDKNSWKKFVNFLNNTCLQSIVII